VLDVHVGLGVVEPADPDEVIASGVVAGLDERFPRGWAGGISLSISSSLVVGDAALALGTHATAAAGWRRHPTMRLR
jgi:hypothetical protein